jgi:hypothetical protein
MRSPAGVGVRTTGRAFNHVRTLRGNLPVGPDTDPRRGPYLCECATTSGHAGHWAKKRGRE